MTQVNLLELVQPNIKKLKAYHVDTVDCETMLHANESPYAPPEEIIEILKNEPKGFQLNRYPDPNCDGLKSVICENLGVDKNQLVIGNGSDELIQLIMQIFCGPGDCIAFPEPTFAMYSIIAQGMGVEAVKVPLDEQWDFKSQTFLEAINKHKPKVLFFSFPNNPTGNCFSESALTEILESFPGIVVLDEAYYDFSRTTFLPRLASHNNLIIMRSLSKIGLAGLRVGYGIADPEIINQIDKIRLPYNSNTVSQTIAEKLLRHFGSVKKQIDSIIQERSRMYTKLSGLDALHVYRSDSNFLLFKVKQEGLSIFKDLAENGILVRDLGAHPRLKNCLRVTIGTPQENDRFLSQIKNLIQPSKLQA